MGCRMAADREKYALSPDRRDACPPGRPRERVLSSNPEPAMSRRKVRPLSRFERRRLRVQRIIFAIIALLVIVSFIVTLVAY